MYKHPRTVDYDGCTISDGSWAGKHERWKDHITIYLTFSHTLQVLFPFCYALSTFSATPSISSGTLVRRKVKSTEMTDLSRIGHSLDCRVYGLKHGHFARLNRTQ